MRKSIPVCFVFCLFSYLSFGQELPKKEIQQFISGATKKMTRGSEELPPPVKQSADSVLSNGVFGVLEKLKELSTKKQVSKPTGGDTLYIGVPPLDSLIITGTYTYNGTILVLGNGILRFKNANATIVGDLYVWGDHAVVTSDSSYLYFPQQFFYQRSLVIAGNGSVVYRNTTLDHSGLSHNLVLTDSAKIELTHVTNIGFTTCGMNKRSEVDINGINQAGEFIAQEESKLNFSHAKTILLWNQVPETGIFHYSFPNGDTLLSYNLDSTTPGISGIKYHIHVDTSTEVMWALMPTNGSDISISNSKIRSIGLWFLGHDTIQVSGLVDNSSYVDYIANLSDRNLHLTNTSVLTWSLYPMDTVNLNVKGCIVGEVGSEANCSVIMTDVFVDGSGGYWWATDHTFMAGENCTAVNDIRSTQNSLFIFAYNTLNQGEAIAMGNSIMMIIQSQLPDAPILYDGSCIWYSYIGNPFSAFVDTIVPISGSAWIDKTPTSQLMDFGWYQMYWQKSGDSTWQPMGGRQYSKKRDEILANWNTHSLKPGLYYEKLVIADNTSDSIQIEAVKGINLLPRIFGVEEHYLDYFKVRIFPDPLTDHSVIDFSLPREEKIEISIVDLNGKIIFRLEKEFEAGENSFPLGSINLPTGCFSCILRSGDYSEAKKFVKR
jgi:hypothetical protein